MLEYLNFFLLCILLALIFYLYIRVKKYLTLLKMAEDNINFKIKEFSKEEVEKLFKNYEAKLSGQIVKTLGKSIINMYSMRACAALGINNQEALSEDLENNPFLNSALQRFTCELYYRFGSFLAPLSVGIITSRHYLSEPSKNGERGTGNNKNGGDEKTVK